VSVPETAAARIAKAWASPADHLAPLIGGTGYRLPVIDGLVWQAVGDPAADNWLVAPADLAAEILTIEFSGRGNVVIYGRGATLRGQIRMLSDDATIILGEDCGPGSDGVINIFGTGRGGLFFMGGRSSVNWAAFFLQSDGGRMIIGEDCMFAYAVVCRTNDDHAIFDMTTGTHLNPAADIHIEPHVWICPEVTILRGVTIGFGSVIGTRSSVTRSVPAYTLAGGQPARVLRENISWDRPALPRREVRDQLAAWHAQIQAIS